MTRRYALDDGQWERIEDLLPGQTGQPGATARDNRLFIDAVLYRYRVSIPWRDLPERFGDFCVVHTRPSRWSKAGVWQRTFEALAQNADNEYAIDPTIVRAHQHSAGAKWGGSIETGHRAQPGWAEYQDPHDSRCLGQPDGLSPHSWADP